MSDIINLPYPNPEIEADFPAEVNRAAQFAPFAALTGYDAAVEETARLTERRIELDDYQKEELNFKLNETKDRPQTVYTITYFLPDLRKKGGEYVSKTGTILKIDEYERIVIMDDGTEIPVNDILTIEE